MLGPAANGPATTLTCPPAIAAAVSSRSASRTGRRSGAMDTPDSTKDRPLSRRRLLKALGTGLVQPLPADVKADLIGAVGEQHVADHGISFAAFGWTIAANRKTAKRIPTTPAEFFDVQNVPGRRPMYGDDQLTGVLYALQ